MQTPESGSNQTWQMYHSISDIDYTQSLDSNSSQASDDCNFQTLYSNTDNITRPSSSLSNKKLVHCLSSESICESPVGKMVEGRKAWVFKS